VSGCLVSVCGVITDICIAICDGLLTVAVRPLFAEC